jgi:DNA-binding XRE family transcriptional regulator
VFNRENFKRVIKNSGLTKSELAGLYGVTRQTIYDWYEGPGAPTQKALAEREASYTSALLVAISKGVLPMKVERDRLARAARVHSMAKALHALISPK